MARSHLIKELDDLLEQDYISTEQHQEIQAYLHSKKSNPLTTIPILPLLGVLLICAGLIAVAASNWVYFPLSLKLGTAFLPLVVASMALIVTKNRFSSTLTECLALAVGMLELLAFGIVSNLYQTPVSTEYLMQLVIASLIPLVYCYKTYWLTAVLLTGVLYGAHGDYLLLSFLGLVAFIPFTVARIRQEEPVRLLTLLHIAAIFRVVLLVSDNEVPVMLLFALLTVSSLFYHEEFFLSLVHKANTLLLFVLSLYGGLLLDMTEHFPFVAIFYAVFACILIGYARFQYYREEFDVQTCKKYGLYGVGLFMTIMPLRLLTVLVILISLSYDTVFFYKEGNLKRYNKKSAQLALFVLLQMALLDFPFMLKGILFILTGVGFLVASLTVSHKMKEGDTHE